MNQLLDKLERKFGNRAVRRLTSVMIGLIIAGYALQMASPNASEFMALDIYRILHGEVWRIITWILIPPSQPSLFTIIMLFFYWSIGSSLERAWGDFRYNVYIFGGLLITLVTAFVSYFVFNAVYHTGPQIGAYIGAFFSTYYICMSILLAFAATFPDSVVLLMFVIPVKMKYFGWIYAAYMLYDAVQYLRGLVSTGNLLYLLPVIAMIASLLNFLLFLLGGRNRIHLTAEQRRRQKEFRKAVQNVKRGGSNYDSGFYRDGRGEKSGASPFRAAARHRCEVCGRTEVTNPELEFRFCSKCMGAHEYCMDHLYAHIHIGEKEIIDVPEDQIHMK